MTERPSDFDRIFDRLDAIEKLSPTALTREVGSLAAEQLALAEQVLEIWVSAHEEAPTDREWEGFRLLALHRQGAKGDPSFNACRETCREAVFQHNVIMAAEDASEQVRALRLMTMVARHLALFISGKLEVAGLGDFCCASKSIRQSADTVAGVANSLNEEYQNA